jgi:hypothetical protein
VDNSKLKNDEMPIKVYKPSGMRKFILVVAIIFIMIHFIIMFRAGSDLGGMMLVFIPFYALLLWILIIQSTQQYLAFYESGLEYRIGNNRIFSRWEDLRSLEIRGSGKSRTVGITTTALEKRQEGNGLERILVGYNTDFIPLSVLSVPTQRDGWTSLAVDTESFAQTDFGRELLHYAPQLFEVAKEKAKRG